MSFFFFFNDTATTEIYTLSLHDALPISGLPQSADERARCLGRRAAQGDSHLGCHRRRSCRGRGGRYRARDSARDRKSTRLNSSHSQISYAVFCLKKKKNKNHRYTAITSIYISLQDYISTRLHYHDSCCSYSLYSTVYYSSHMTHLHCIHPIIS